MPGKMGRIALARSDEVISGGRKLTGQSAEYALLKDVWVWSNIAPYAKYLLQIGVIILVTICINFAIPLLSRSIVNDGILTGDLGFVNVMVLVQSALFGALILLNTVRSKISFHISSRLVARVTLDYFRHVIALPMSYFQTQGSGTVGEHVRDLERVQRFAAVELIDATASLVSIVSLSLLLLWIDTTICLVFVTSAASYLLWITLIGKQRRVADSDRFRESARARAIEIGIVDAIQDMKIAGHEDRSLASWAKVQIAALQTRLKSGRIEQLQTSGGHLCTRVGMVLVTYFSARNAILGEITLGDFTITSVITVQLYFYVNQLLDFVNKLDDVRSALRRVHGVLSSPPERTSSAIPVPSLAVFPIEFRDISFAYPGSNRLSLTAISFAAEQGSMTALIGPSGSGKTTILKLMLRLYEPTAGQIAIAGQPLSTIDHADWRSRIGAVMQDGALFAASMRDNILAGRDLDRRWLDQVIGAACLEDVISEGADGLDTIVGPGGTRLSAGQVQRLLIGRALYKRPSLLLLDEATSALDNRNESSVIANVRALLPGVTSIVAAHRLNTIAHADRILLVDGSRIIGSNTPDQLLGMNAGRLGLSQIQGD